MSKLTHINSNGEAQMVDVSEKNNTSREAKAGAKVLMKPETLDLIVSGSHKKEMSSLLQELLEFKLQKNAQNLSHSVTRSCSLRLVLN